MLCKSLYIPGKAKLGNGGWGKGFMSSYHSKKRNNLLFKTLTLKVYNNTFNAFNCLWMNFKYVHHFHITSIPFDWVYIELFHVLNCFQNYNENLNYFFVNILFHPHSYYVNTVWFGIHWIISCVKFIEYIPTRARMSH